MTKLNFAITLKSRGKEIYRITPHGIVAVSSQKPTSRAMPVFGGTSDDILIEKKGTKANSYLKIVVGRNVHVLGTRMLLNFCLKHDILVKEVVYESSFMNMFLVDKVIAFLEKFRENLEKEKEET